MNAWVEFSFEIYCWVHLPNVQDPGTQAPEELEFPLPSPCSCLWFYFPNRVLLLNAHLGTFSKQSRHPQESFSLILGLFSFTT